MASKSQVSRLCEEIDAQWRRVLRPKVSKLASLMDEAEADVLAT